MPENSPSLPSVEMAQMILETVGWRASYNRLLRRPEFIRLDECPPLSPGYIPPHARHLDAEPRVLAALRAHVSDESHTLLPDVPALADMEGGQPWRALSYKNAWMAFLEALPGDADSVYDPVAAYGVLLDGDGQEVAAPALPVEAVLPHYTMLQRARHPVTVWQPVAVVSPQAAEQMLPEHMEQYTEQLFEIRPLPQTRAEAKRRAEASQGKSKRVLVFYDHDPTTAAGEGLIALPALPTPEIALHSAVVAYEVNPRQRIIVDSPADQYPAPAGEWHRPVSDLACDIAAQILEGWDDQRRPGLVDLIMDTHHTAVTMVCGTSRDETLAWLNLGQHGIRLRDDVASLLRRAGKESYTKRGRRYWRTQGISAPVDETEDDEHDAE